MSSSATNATALPLELVYNEEGQLFCVVCRRSVPMGGGSIGQHLTGKKHEKCARTSSPEENSKLREKILAKVAAAEASRQPPAPKASETPAPVSRAGPVVQLDPQSTHPLRNLQIDKDEFLNSILADIEKSASSAEESSTDDDSTILTASKRAQAFAPIEYRPPDGVDNFFDSMPVEEERTTQPAELRAILGSAPPKKKAAQTGNEDAASSRTPVSISLVLNVQDAEMEEAETKNEEGSDSDDEPMDGMPPWLLAPDVIQAVKYTSDTSLALHYEILEFARFMSPTATESSNREKVATTVLNIVKTLWPNCHIEMFGSYATGLYLPSSDIDICVMDTPLGGDMSEVHKVARAVRNLHGFARRVNVIKARVSLVKLVAREGGVQCDISFNQSNGPKNVPVIRRYLKHYPALRPLLLVVKCFLQQRSLNEVFTGGLGSYAVLLLVVSHLQMLRYNFQGTNANLGAVLQQFFNLYGRLFNYCIAGIAVKDDGCYYNKVERYDTIPSETIRFSIEDPNDETNEIGKNSYGAARVRKAFSNAWAQLNKWSRDSLTGPPTPLSAILQHDSAFRKRRKQVRDDLQNRGILSLSTSIKAGVFSCGVFTPAEGAAADRDTMVDDSSDANADVRRSKRMRTHLPSENRADYAVPHQERNPVQIGGSYSAPYVPPFAQHHQNQIPGQPLFNGSSYAAPPQAAYPSSHQDAYYAYDGPTLSAEMQMRLGGHPGGGGSSRRRDRGRRGTGGRARGISHPLKRRGRSRGRAKYEQERS